MIIINFKIDIEEKRYKSRIDNIKANAMLLMEQNQWCILSDLLHADITVHTTIHKTFIKNTIDPTLVTKGITDALNGICYKDDSQIVSANMRKLYADKDYIEVSFREVR